MKKKGLIICVLAAMVISLAGVTCYYWYINTYFVDTEDARVAGTILKVSPQVSAKLVRINVDEGDTVQAGDIIARQDDISLPSATSVDLTVIKAPVSGTILKKIGNVGEVGTPGQAVVMMADLSDLYITADIEETDMYKLKLGQKAEFTIDSIPGVKFNGEVYSLGEATVSTFSLLPTQNTGGNFTKVIQRIPVKISIKNSHGQRLLPGMNAVVRIHVR
ncbi:MAG: putative multidrug resistance protein EmrK [Pelotomaculum sp. PtaU1.Bin035]|nr:MAG: putative multidrug resistance protein EmrK [Pelotomaculum sp. PtaU1.Bin035]